MKLFSAFYLFLIYLININNVSGRGSKNYALQLYNYTKFHQDPCSRSGDTFKETSIHLNICIYNINCTLILNTDFGEPSPVYIKNGTYLAPNTPSGAILLSRSDILLVGCPGNKKFVVLGNQTTNFNAIEVHCLHDNVFRSGRWIGQFKDIKCTSLPWFSAEETSESCASRNKLYRVGYNIRDVFYTLYTACFSRQLLSTLYVHHEIRPWSNFMQNSSSRPNFIEGGVFDKVQMSKVYAVQNQKYRLNQILGDNMDQQYITRTQFLNRGHLAARADFVMRATQKASFHYINSAPQWMRGNAGDWAALEDALRRRISSYGSGVKVYTGTYGVAKLADKDGHLQELFLHIDGNNNRVIPVPMYFYKLIYDAKKETAVAFISINSSYYNITMIDKLTFCDDICDDNRNYSWVRWRPNDGTHSFCCEYEDFVKYVNYLPRLNVNGIFY